MARASVHIVNPSAGTQYVLAASDVAYILINASARSDTSGRFRFVPEIVVVAEAVALSVAKAFTEDSFGLADATTASVTKVLSNSVSITETFVATLIFIRNFSDAVTVSEVYAATITKALLDFASVSDAAAHTLTKSLSSGVAMNDSFDAGDGAVFVFTKDVSNIVFTDDSRVLSTDKLIGDMIEPVDTGMLTVQNYCDITYFAADYVGVSQTFS